MIISASRRTDIPAFYSDWFMNRIQAGFCLVPNPFNTNQISRLSLLPEDVDAIVFWSKNPRPMLAHIPTLTRMGYAFYFLFTLLDSPKAFEPHVPPLQHRIDTFRSLAEMLGPNRVVWRYDPIIISSLTSHRYHRERFAALAQSLDGATSRVIVSFVDYYRKTNRRIAPLEQDGITFDRKTDSCENTTRLLAAMAETAHAHGMQIQTCAETKDYSNAGIPPGACIDVDLIRRIGGRVTFTKDPGQRQQCLCTTSRDIGVPDTCLHGCIYCYATRSHKTALRRHCEHDPTAPTLWAPASDS